LSNIGINSGVSIYVVSYDGTRTSRQFEKVPNDKVKFIRDAIGIMGIKESDYYAFVNYNYRNLLCRTDAIKSNSVIEFIDVDYVELVEPELFSFGSKRRRTLDIEQKINDANESGDVSDTVAYLEQKLAAVGVDEPAKNTLGRRGKGDPGDYVEEVQVINVSWDNTDNRQLDYFSGPGQTGPNDTDTFDITIITEDGQPTDRDFVVTVEIDSNITEGVGYVQTNFVVPVLAGTVSGYAYSAIIDVYDDEIPSSLSLTLTADNGVIPVGTVTNPLTVTYMITV